jgi:hypothetical protein
LYAIKLFQIQLPTNRTTTLMPNSTMSNTVFSALKNGRRTDDCAIGVPCIGGIIALLLWIYVSGCIFIFGAFLSPLKPKGVERRRKQLWGAEQKESRFRP